MSSLTRLKRKHVNAGMSPEEFDETVKSHLSQRGTSKGLKKNLKRRHYINRKLGKNISSRQKRILAKQESTKQRTGITLQPPEAQPSLAQRATDITQRAAELLKHEAHALRITPKEITKDIPSYKRGATITAKEAARITKERIIPTTIRGLKGLRKYLSAEERIKRLEASISLREKILHQQAQVIQLRERAEKLQAKELSARKRKLKL